MPKGVYVRTKLNTKKAVLIGKVNTIIENSEVALTIKEIYTVLASSGVYVGSYSCFAQRHFAPALRRGAIDASCIRKGGGHPRKLKVGDQVRIENNGPTPKSLASQLRVSAPRTVVKVISDGTKNVAYFLGSNGQGCSELGSRRFRACELTPYVKRSRAGRPRQRRRYRRLSQPSGCPSTSGAFAGLCASLATSPSIMSVNGDISRLTE
jgi:hypothetical protein